MHLDSINQRLANLSPKKRQILSDRLSKLANTSKRLIAPRPIDFPCLASFAQQRFWFVQQLFPQSSVYNNSRTLKFTQPANIKAINKALYAIIDRHEVLRTTYKMEDDGKLYQIIHSVDAINIPIPIIDLSDRHEYLEAEVRKHTNQPFNLSFDFPLRNILFKLNGEEYTLLIVIHHIASDRWSSQIFLTELNYFYETFLTDQPSILPALSIQYADFSIWQRTQFSQNKFQKQLDYWKAKLKDQVSTINLPTDYPRPHISSNQGQSISITISKPLTNALKILSQSSGVTLFITLLTAFKILLYRYSHQTDITVGTPISGRNNLETEHLIGCFLNTLPLRTKILETLSFKELLSQVRATVLEAQSHQEIPFEKVIEELKIERDLSYSPLFQVLFNFHNLPKVEQKASQSWFNISTFDSRTTEFDLAITLREIESELVGTFIYSTDLFKDITIAGMKNHYENLLQSIVDNPDRSISTIPFLTFSEQVKILKQWNDTFAEYPHDKCIHQLFEEQVERTPKNIAVVFEDQEITYRELNNRANQLACHLQTLGVKPEVLVGICVERSIEMIVGLLGILKAGGAYVPLDPAYPQERLDYLVKDAQLDNPIVSQTNLTFKFASCTNIVDLERDQKMIAQQSTQNLKSDITSENLAYVIYTSGSTGNPKGVQIRHSNVVNLLSNICPKLNLTCEDTVCTLTTIAFDVAVSEIFLTLMIGARLRIVSSEVAKDGYQLAEVIRRSPITFMISTPATWQMLLTVGWQGSNQLKVIVTGEALSQELASRLLPKTKELWNLYGPTETTIWSSFYLVKSSTKSPPIGRPLPNVTAYILDAYLQPVPIGVLGELHIGGHGLARGYLNRPELTNQKFIANPFGEGKVYKTGDLARYMPDGNIEFIGRIDNQVKIRGFRIELGEIEAVLSKHPDIINAVAIAREDIPGDKRIVAYVVSQVTLSQRELREFLKQKLPEYMIPSTFVILEQLPLTPSGKIDRRALPKPEISRETEFSPPSNRTEEIITSIWSEVLGIPEVDRRDNFFEIGGHSLLATQVISRLQIALKQEISIRSLFEHPTPVQLAEAIEQKYHLETTLTIIEPLKNRENLPLSFAQFRMWFLYQLEGESATYNVPLVLKLEGNLNIKSLEKAFQTIVDRHEIFRTSFNTIDGSPVQIIAPSLQVTLSVIDLTELAELSVQKQVEELAHAESNHTFKLTVSPLFRAKILKLKENSHILLMNFHHIIIDGWSMGILRSELSILYQNFIDGESVSLAPLPIQYADFSYWQKNWLQGEVLTQQLSYWKQQLANIPAILELPTDRPRPNVQTYRGKSQKIKLSAEVSQRLRDLSQESGVTLFMTLLSAFGILLSRYSHQENIVIGSPIANRNRQETEKLIGFFANTLALKISIKNNPSFKELLKSVKEVCLDAYSHQDLPYEKLVEELKPERSLSHAPVFQVMFILQNTPQETLTLPDLTLQSIELKSQTSKFDISLSLTESRAGIMGTWEYNTDLFDDTTIEGMSSHFQVLLAGIIAEPDLQVKKLPILTEQEKHQLLIEWNDTSKEYPHDKCIHQLFEEQVERTPENIAVVFEDQQITYRELNNRVNQLGHYFQTLGVKPEILVGICVERSIEMIVGLLGILKAGGAYVPLDPNYPKERLQFILDDIQTPFLLTQHSLLGNLSLDKFQVIYLDTDLEEINGEDQDNPNCGTIPTDLAYIIYTSGSTGKPKGVCTIHRSVVRLVKGIDYVNLNSLQTFLQLAPLAFDASTFEIWGSLLNGSRLVIFPPHAPSLQKLGQVIQQHQISTLWLTSGLFNLMVDNHIEDLKPIRQLLAGGDVLSIPHVQKALSTLKNCHLINGYGPTEGTTFTCTHLISETTHFRSSVPIGRPISNTQVYILDRYMQLVPIGVSGELYIGGDGLARSYLNQPELTAEKFIANPFGNGKLYKSGDVARYLPDGNIEFIGRIDNQVKIRGFRIELGEIEAVLSKHPDIINAVAIAREDIPGDKRIVAYIVSQVTLTNNKLRNFLKGQLPEYMTPSAFVFLDQFPLNANGKVDRSALPNPQSSMTTNNFIPPRDRTEQQLATIWEKHLNHHPISINDNFFDLGGHSLLSIRLVLDIEKAFNCTLPLMSFFKLSTIEELALWLRRHEQETMEIPSGLTLKYYRDLLAHSAGRQGNHIGRRGLIVEVMPNIDNAYGTNSQPFVWIGDIKVAKNLRLQQPIYVMPTFSHQTLVDSQEEYIEIEAIASLLVDELLTVHTSDSFMLGGYCFEGLIAIEMANQLKKRRKEITLLVLLETYPKPSILYKLCERLDQFISIIKLLLLLSIDDKWHYLIDRINKYLNPKVQSKPTIANPSIADMGSKIYNRRPYNDRVLLFMGTRKIRFIVKENPLFCSDFSWLFPYYGWERLLKGDVTVIKIPCGHDIISQPNIEYLSPILDQKIMEICNEST
ncbi:amino acid adenylation enzyme/thioester reductase family protein [Synechococcus sp. PCC 7502]|uniref:non-ribosomal peptide synthetase n=1 Tax=Synechococcus sp. PCC 7502 TaxID=1173263 RepID=UPI00029FDB02|nr:non-ribosomal peptide synthetase [Synechococcus sp. PCC 7502]AFY74910.1 amino acid adenylation enzyme/thioester reductase family protein [Synechococcus sp. PCC 7502]